MELTPAIPAAPPRKATLEEWLAIPEERRAEPIGGRIIYQGMPKPVHGMTQGDVFALARGSYGRRPGGADKPGGWWISQEVDLHIAGMGCRPDVLGWLRDKHPVLPEPNSRGVVTSAPDWICEVLSPRTAHVDMGEKRVGYHRAGVSHYWLVDPANRTVTVLRWTADGYLVELSAGPGDKVRAPPFVAVEIDVAELFGDDEEEEPGREGVDITVVAGGQPGG